MKERHIKSSGEISKREMKYLDIQSCKETKKNGCVTSTERRRQDKDNTQIERGRKDSVKQCRHNHID